MKVSQALSIFTHLIALIGFFTICFTGQVGVIGIGIFLSALLFSFINERFHRQYYLSPRLVNLLAFGLLTYVFLNPLLFEGEVFNVILTFLIYTQVIKLLGRKELRDLVQIFVLSFFHFLAGTILTVDFSYGIVFVVYVSVALWAIMVFTMRKESVDASNNDDPAVVTPLFLSTTVVISFGIFAFTALIFISIPRIKSGVLTGAFLQPHVLKSGFSDEVKLGQVGEIKLDNSPVMRIRIPNGAIPESVYWRGIALDHFDGTAWRASQADHRLFKNNSDGVIRVKRSAGKVLTQEIITEPLDTDVIFAGSVPVGFQGLSGGRLAKFNDSYVLPAKLSYRLKYIAYSDLSVPPARELRKEKQEYTAPIRKRYLQLPPLGENIKELADEITELDGNAFDKAASIERYLATNMNYTRTLAEGTGEYPLESFLFGNRAGHCEYFATAMVVLLREVGVPARIVNGFLRGEWNQYGNFFLVRESDAHSWVEVYFPQEGWVLFDPTPAFEGEPGSYGSLSFISSYVDHLKYKWSRYVVDFNQQDQIRLFEGVHNGWTWRKNELQRKSHTRLSQLDKRWLMAVVIVALLGWTLYTRSDLKYVLINRSGRTMGKASLLYKNGLRILSKRGYSKPEYLTPREFAREVVLSGGARFKTFLEFTERYLDLRFGGESGKAKLEELKAILDRMRKEIK